MLKRIVDRLVDSLSSDAADSDDRDALLRHATAVLLIDVARADHVFDDDEMTRVVELLEDRFGLGTGEVRELVDSASADADELVGVHEFTEALHRHLDEDDKAQVVGMLWAVAYADGKLDKYENSLVLKISDLLYVSRGRVMRLKHDAAVAAGAA